jgi:hypothetical protein
MSKFELKSKVYKMRTEGLSIGRIAYELNLSKSTVSLWCGDMKLPQSMKDELKNKMILAGHRGRLKGAETNKNKKISSILKAKEWARNQFSVFSSREKMIACTALYWAEGSKTESTTGFVFVNSDPKMIYSVYKWLLESGLILTEDIKPRLSINIVHKPRIKKVLNFWSNLLELPTAQFGNVFYIKTPPKKLYSNHDHYYGILRLGVRRSTNLKYKILALVDRMKDTISMPM